MIPLKLAVRNFLCYRDDVPPLDLSGVHVACLCGANGHGKSALLDAMTWCLWGQARTGSRNHNALIAYGETECRVELDFLAQGQAYRAIRRRRSSGQGRTELDLFVLSDADEPRPITGNSVNETSARTRSLVGMDYDTFVNSAFLLQGRSDEFTRKTPSERKEVLSAILGLGLYEVLQAAARGRRSEWQDDANRHEGALTQTKSALDAVADPQAELAMISERMESLAWELADSASAARERREALGLLQRKQTGLAESEKRINALRNDIRQAESNMTTLAQRIGASRNLAARSDEIRAGVQQLMEARDDLERLESIRLEYNRLHNRRNDLQVAISREHAAVSSEAVELERRIREDLKPAAGRDEYIVGKLAELTATERRMLAEQDTIDAESAELTNLSAGIATQGSELERCIVEGRELRQKQREMSGAGGPDALCPLCRTPLSEDACDNIAEWYESEIAAKLQRHKHLARGLEELTQRREHLSGDIESRRGNLTQRQRQSQQARGRLEQERLQCDEARNLLMRLEPQLLDLRTVIATDHFAQSERESLRQIEGEISALAYDDARREEAFRLTQSLQRWQTEQVALDSALAQLPQDEAELRNNETQADRWRQELTDTEKSLSEDHAALAELPELERATRDAEARLTGLSQERDGLLAKQGRLQGDAERRRAYQAEIVRLRQRHTAAQAEQAVYAELFAAFGRSGVPAMLIDAAVPHIENEANHLLGRMTDNRLTVKMETQRVTQGGNTTETLDILISDELGSRSYELFSGGEAFRINLALRIALSKVLSQRLGAPMPTLFIDEGFGTQDAAGRERIVDAIASIQDEFEKIIVITHLDELKDLFPARIEVLKTEAGSQFWLS